MSTYRKYNCWPIIASQYAAAISTVAKEQICYAFIFKIISKQALENVYKAIGSDFDNEKEFKEKLEEFTKDQYSCMLFIAYADGERYFQFKAPEKIKNIKFVY
jgi:hypothetical protein